jgi:dethiobiotin synthetase
MNRIFVTGISTEVGKTLASAIITEALEADYWKPVQAGELELTDCDKVANLISNPKTVFHSTSYALETPMSPHAAAAIEGIAINLENIKPPQTNNTLVIEGAGGILVPLNETDTILDLIEDNYKVVVVSRHYLGSINHTLLTVQAIQQAGLECFLLFNGEENPSTESIIKLKTKIPVLGRIPELNTISKAVIRQVGALLKPTLETYLLK